MNLLVDLLSGFFLPWLGLPHGGQRRTAAGCSAFAAAVRWSTGFHGDAAVMSLAAEHDYEPAFPIEMFQVVVFDTAPILSPRCNAVNQRLFARVQTNDHVNMVASDDLVLGAGGTCELTALSDLQSPHGGGWVPIGMLPTADIAVFTST